MSSKKNGATAKPKAAPKAKPKAPKSNAERSKERRHKLAKMSVRDRMAIKLEHVEQRFESFAHKLGKCADDISAGMSEATFAEATDTIGTLLRDLRTGIESLPDNYAPPRKSPGRKPIAAGALVKIKEKHAERWAKVFGTDAIEVSEALEDGAYVSLPTLKGGMLAIPRSHVTEILASA